MYLTPPLIDGGVFCNNPAMSGYVEALRLRGSEDHIVVSLGTGNHSKSYQLSEVQKLSTVRWIQPLLSSVFDGQSDAVDYQLNQVLNENHFRFQTILSPEHTALDDFSEANIEGLRLAAHSILALQKGRVTELIAKLL